MLIKEKTDIRGVVVDVVKDITGVLSVTDKTQLDLSSSLMVLGECANQLEVSIHTMDWINGSMTVEQIVQECERAFLR